MRYQQKHKQMMPHASSITAASTNTVRTKPSRYRRSWSSEVNKIAAQIPNAKVIQPPGVKTFERAWQKARGKEYGGDWDRMKDLNRCTLVVSRRQSDIQSAFGVS